MAGWNEPTATLALLEKSKTLDLFLEGLRLHYVECFAQGRSDVWCKCARSLIDLIEAMDTPPYLKRSDLP